MKPSKRPDRELPSGATTDETRAVLLDFAREIASFEGWELISAGVPELRAELEWECEKNHRWRQSLGSVRKSTRWCPECRKLGVAPDQLAELAKLKAHAEEQGGRCLSESYTGSKGPLEWICEKGHPFSDHANKVWNRSKRGAFCPECGKKRRGNRSTITLVELQSLAESKGGKCLASRYKNAREDLEWECEERHRFWKNANRVLHQRDWCAICAGNSPLDIKWFQDYAAGKGGLCLSGSIENMHSRLRFRCDAGHEWSAIAGSVRQTKSWCGRCSPNAKATREDADRLAESRGGKCLGRTRGRRGEALWRWKCANGDEWEQQYSTVKRGSWCGKCSAKLGERICRAFFDEIFGVSFPRCRPRWLRSERGVPLELDGYSSELKVAFEHQGQQHYRKSDFFDGDLSDQIARDGLKATICEANGVRLVVIPEVGRLTPQPDLPKFLASEFQRLKIKPPRDPETIGIDWSSVYSTTEENRLLEELAALVAQRGGRLISETWRGADSQHAVRCEHGHEFQEIPGNLRKGRWCRHPECKAARAEEGKIKTAQKNLVRICKAAESHGGECVSTEFLGWKNHHEFKCGCGNQWSANAGSLVWKGTWCPKCGVSKMLASRKANKSCSP